MNQNIGIPVLFIVFNRPYTTEKVFDEIRKSKPPRLYVAADGPRNEGDRDKCEEVRKISTNIDWDCEIKTLFREQNIGCKMAVSGGIDWFFENEEMGVILEDDCLPNNSFFRFSEEILKKYKDDQSIMHINGNNFGAGEENFFKSNYSYHFGNMPQAWGWASWRRAWEKFDCEINNLDELVKSDYLEMLFPNKNQRSRQMKRWKQVIGGKIDTWDYQWQFSVISNHGLTVIPKVNQISNIGFGKDATHTKNKNSYKEDLETELIKFPLTHPSLLVPDSKINQWYQNNMLETRSIINRIRKKIKLLK